MMFLSHKEFEVQLILGLIDDQISDYAAQRVDAMYLRTLMKHYSFLRKHHRACLYQVIQNPICPDDLSIYVGLLTWKYDLPFPWKMFENNIYHVHVPFIGYIYI